MIRPRFSATFNKFSALSLQKFVRLYSYSSSVNPRPASSFYHGDSEGEESIVYKHKLQFQPPGTITLEDLRRNHASLSNPVRIKWEDLGRNYASLSNSVNFMGKVLFPPKIMRTAEFSVYTLLRVNSSRDSKDSFRICLVMRENMAEIASKYLKGNDFIYVSGNLGSYTKVDENGSLRILYKVYVKELNYVACSGKPQNNQQYEKLEPKEEATSKSGALDLKTKMDTSAPEMKTKTDNLYLWQVFFASPHEWWDNRKRKKNPKSPDFKHKDTGESLWLSPSDPPWVSRQLKLHDSRMAEHGYQDFGNSRSRVSMWKYDEY